MEHIYCYFLSFYLKISNIKIKFEEGACLYSLYVHTYASFFSHMKQIGKKLKHFLRKQWLLFVLLYIIEIKSARARTYTFWFCVIQTSEKHFHLCSFQVFNVLIVCLFCLPLLPLLLINN
jgi:hypothetical protein